VRQAHFDFCYCDLIAADRQPDVSPRKRECPKEWCNFVLRPWFGRFAATAGVLSARKGQNGVTVMKGLFNDPQLFSRRPASAATTVSDDFYLSYKHVLQDIPKL